MLAGHLSTNSPVGLPCRLATMNSELRAAPTCSSGLARLCCMFASRCSEAAAAASFCLISACSRSGDSRVRSRTSFQLRKSERSRANTMARARGGINQVRRRSISVEETFVRGNHPRSLVGWTESTVCRSFICTVIFFEFKITTEPTYKEHRQTNSRCIM